MKNQKGITLVALIITIIVMLILAGVSISLVVGEDGVLTQAQTAGKKQEAAAAQQAISLAMSGLTMDYYGDKDNASTIFSNDELKDAIVKNGAYDTAGGDNITVSGNWGDTNKLTVVVNGYTFEVTLSGESAGSTTYPLQAVKIVNTSGVE